MGVYLRKSRANFISKLINKFPERVEVVQEIVGHSKNDDKKLTIQTYGKGFNIQLKKEMIDSIELY